jgi:hypothetical protein
MDHASQRLVKELLQCARDLSDMSTTKMDISYLLSRLVQLLGGFLSLNFLKHKNEVEFCVA